MKRTSDEIVTELLVLRSQDGDRHAWKQLVQMWQPKLYRHARRLTDHAEAANDVTQEAWMAILRGLNRLDDPARFRPWAFRIVGNKAVDWTRRQQRRRKHISQSGVETPDDELSPTEQQIHDEDVGALLQAIYQLAPEKRAIISMFYQEGMSQAEIAQAVNVPVGTVKSRLHSIRQELKSLIERKEP